MFELSIELEKYIEDHIDPEDVLLTELYRKTYQKILNPRMTSGHIQGKILEMLSKMIKPTYILEIGTFTGYSALCLVKGLSETGALHTIEINDEIADFTHSFFDQSPFRDKIKFHIGDAIDIIPSLDIIFDLVFIDGEKKDYCKYYELAVKYTHQDSYILVDNILWDGKVVDKVAITDYSTNGIIEFNELVMNDGRVEKAILPFRDGLMILRKK